MKQKILEFLKETPVGIPAAELCDKLRNTMPKDEESYEYAYIDCFLNIFEHMTTQLLEINVVHLNQEQKYEKLKDANHKMSDAWDAIFEEVGKKFEISWNFYVSGYDAIFTYVFDDITIVLEGKVKVLELARKEGI